MRDRTGQVWEDLETRHKRVVFVVVRPSSGNEPDWRSHPVLVLDSDWADEERGACDWHEGPTSYEELQARGVMRRLA